jgi:hypothetical protein
MKNLARSLAPLVIGLTGVLAPSCATTQRVTDPIVSTVKDCADQTTHAVALGILDDVSAILLCDGGNAAALPGCVIAQLGVVAKNAGWPAIDCVLAEIQKKAAANVAASEDTMENLRARRATAAIAWRAGVAGATSSP